MEIVFLNNLMEAAKDLEDDEILFCPMGLWSDYIEKGLGGIVEEGNKVRPFSEEEVISVKEQLFYNNQINSKQNFFYVVKPDLIRRDLKGIFEEIRKNREYLKKEIVEDLRYVEKMLEYDLFVFVPHVSEGYGHDREAEVVKSMIENEVGVHLVEGEKKKKRLYRDSLETLEYTLNFLKRVGNKEIKKTLNKNLEFYILFPERVRDIGLEGYLKVSRIYKEARKQDSNSLIILPWFFPSSKPVENYMEIVNGMGTKSLFNLNIDEVKFGKVYLVFGEYKIDFEGQERSCIIGLPLFKVKSSLVGSEFRSRNVVARKRDSAKTNKGVALARLKVWDFTIKALYGKEPRVLKKGPGERVVEVDEKFSITISLRERRKESTIGGETYYVGSPGCKVCDIEIREDGSFSTKLDHSNLYFISINDTRGKEKYSPGLRNSELIEKLASGKGVERVGDIIKESKDNEKVVYVLREYFPYQGDDVMGNYLELSFREILKALLPKIREKIERDHYSRLELDGEREKELVEKTQTGFFQSRINRVIKYLKSIEIELCFSSRDGERHLIKHPEVREPEDMVEELDLYRKVVDVEGLKGEKKNIESLLKLISHSYPLLNSSMTEKLMEELKDRVESFLARKNVPIEEVEVSIEDLVPRMSLYDPGTLVLFLPEEGKIKAYTNGTKAGRVLKDLKVAIGNLELDIKSR